MISLPASASRLLARRSSADRLLTLIFAPAFARDMARIIAHLEASEAVDIQARAQAIIRALDILLDSPMIGRPVPDGLRELVIGRDARGYVVRYRFDEATDDVVIANIRGQREAGFARAPIIR